MSTSPLARTAPVLLSEESTLMDAVPTPELQHGGKWSTSPTFNTAAVPAPGDEPADPVEEYLAEHDATPEQAAGMREIRDIIGDSPERAARALELIEQERAARKCTALGGACVEHEDDHGEIIHRGVRHVESGPFGEHLLEHRLVQWSDASGPVLGFVGDYDWPDLDLPAVDALVAATERQLASLRDCRAHLAAALGEAPPTQPPEPLEARPADGATGTEAQA